MNEIYEQLTAPFSHTFKKPGSNLDYITGEQVTSRLNEALGWDGWSFEVKQHGYNEEADELWVLGELRVVMPTTTACISKQQFGSQKPNRYSGGKNEGKVIDLGFDLKGAATDALKKCASLIGVGLYLHEKESSQTQRQQPSRPTPPPVPNSPASLLGFDPEELKRLVAEAGLKNVDLVPVTGAGGNGGPRPQLWLNDHPGKTLADLVAAAVEAKKVPA